MTIDRAIKRTHWQRPVALLITVMLAGLNAWPNLVAARRTASNSIVVPQNPAVPLLSGTVQVINNEPGNATNPDVDGNLASYTQDDFQGTSAIHYFDFVTNTDHTIPGNSVDLLSEIDGSRIAYTEVDFDGDHVKVFDVASQATTTVPGVWRSDPSIGGNMVAFMDQTAAYNADSNEISVYDLTTGTVTRLTNDTINDHSPSVSPSGDVVVWEKCPWAQPASCDIYSATRTGPGTFVTKLLTGPGEDRAPQTNGQFVVYMSNKNGAKHVCFQPVDGGEEVCLAVTGNWIGPTISGDLIAFESQRDIFVYQISTGDLFQATNTPLVDEYLSQINVTDGIGRIAYVVVGNDAFDAYAFTFNVPYPSLQTLTGISQVVNNGPGDQSDPHVDCNLVSYTSKDLQTGASQVHYFDFVTNTDRVIPGNSRDSFSDVSSGRIGFTELTSAAPQIVVFDSASQSRINTFSGCSSALGGNLMSWQNACTPATSPTEVSWHDLTSGTGYLLTDDGVWDLNPAVSPGGNAVVWERCQTSDFVGCDINAAIQTEPGVITEKILTGKSDGDLSPDTNGEIVVYASKRGGETDIYFQPLMGGDETRLSIPGVQRDVSISGNFIVFDSQVHLGALTEYDVFVYDISNDNLYQITNTPVDETVGDVSVCGDVGRIVYAVAGTDKDVYAFTFHLSPTNQINDLITVVRSFHLSRWAELFLVPKLMGAQAALSISDTATADTALMAFIDECQAQSGKKLTVAQATQLVNYANQIRSSLGALIDGSVASNDDRSGRHPLLRRTFHYDSIRRRS